MDNGAGRALAGLEGLADDVLPALGQHLDGDIFRNHVVLDEGAQEFVLRLRGGGEAHLDFLEADAQQQVVEFQLFFQAHGNHQALVSVPQIHAAPLGRFFDVILLYPFVVCSRRRIVPDGVFGGIHVTRLLTFCGEAFDRKTSKKISPVSYIRKETGLCIQNLAVPLFLPPMRPLMTVRQPSPAVSVGLRPSYWVSRSVRPLRGQYTAPSAAASHQPAVLWARK